MPKEEKNSQFLAIRSMFLSGNVRRMKDIEKLYPTLVAKSLRLNHSRYIQKLYKPGGFTMQQLNELAKLLEVDIRLILDVIVPQLNSPTKGPKRKTE